MDNVCQMISLTLQKTQTSHIVGKGAIVHPVRHPVVSGGRRPVVPGSIGRVVEAMHVIQVGSVNEVLIYG